MRIVLATGIYPPDIGGPAMYVAALERSLVDLGHEPHVVSYGFEKKLPIGVRHIWYFFRVLKSLKGRDAVIAFDTFSVGVPTAFATRILRKLYILRIGGDFLWESYVERTKQEITLAKFNEKLSDSGPQLSVVLSLKERIIFKCTKIALAFAESIVFSTVWQRDIWEYSYRLDSQKLKVIENFYGKKDQDIFIKSEESGTYFFWAGRSIKLKNGVRLRFAQELAQKQSPEHSVNVIMKSGLSHEEVLKNIRNCYAVIVPSFSEVSPNLAMEAIEMGKPIILTNETGIKDRLGDVALYVNPFDEKDIAEKILWLLDKDNYGRQKEKVRLFEFEHSYKDITNEFVALMKGTV